jgi:transcriptional regulator with XRE-family HTH domain
MERFDLKAARLNAGLSARALGRLVGVSHNTINKIEHGVPVRPDLAKRVADHFDIQVVDLLPSLLEDRSAA